MVKSVEPKLELFNHINPTIADHLLENGRALEEVKGRFSNKIIEVISQECARGLDHVSTIPRLYRRTNKEVYVPA
jgi:hypothetical protein